uniref:Endonuclease 8-like 1 isoform X2 n=1 Tax=Camelus bactrianus TaxID=9837 RepID=A0A9W3G5L3_CAMBA|nr:endonuclease 8-like 1 isoform X2 [Camelus bactrianus]
MPQRPGEEESGKLLPPPGGNRRGSERGVLGVPEERKTCRAWSGGMLPWIKWSGRASLKCSGTEEAAGVKACVKEELCACSRENVLRNLADKAFDRPICEALLDQRFFNGIGNYLRAEILHRLRIPPFEKARTVLEALQQRRLGDPGPLAPKGGKSRKKKSKGARQGPEDRVEDPPPPNKSPSKTRRARRGLPEQTTAQQPKGPSLQQDPEAPPVPEKGKRRRRPATSGHHRPQKVKADTPSLEPEGTSAS